MHVPRVKVVSGGYFGNVKELLVGTLPLRSFVRNDHAEPLSVFGKRFAPVPCEYLKYVSAFVMGLDRRARFTFPLAPNGGFA